MLLLFRAFTEEESENKELAFLRYVKCVPFLDEVDRALKCEFPQSAIARSAEKGHVVEKKEIDGDFAAADEWVGAIPFQSIVSAVKTVFKYFAVHPLPKELP